MELVKKIIIGSLFFQTNAIGAHMEYSNEFRIRLKEELIADEGSVLKVYRDHLGYYTVGVGHLITPKDEEWGVDIGTPITQTRADELFFYDLNNILKECEEHFKSWSKIKFNHNDNNNVIMQGCKAGSVQGCKAASVKGSWTY